MSLSDIRRLTIDDLTGCLELAANRDWPREEHKWRLLFDVGEVYGIVEPGAGVVATTIVTRYGGGAAISMVLVAARHERKGLGGRLMRHALERSGDGAVMLYATEFGRPLYERLGFEDVARTLIADLAAGDARPLRVDVGHEFPGLRAWVSERGLAPRFAVTRMAVGGRQPGDRTRSFAPLMQALG